MKFELDGTLIDDILFHMENQDGDFYLDAKKGYVVNPGFDDSSDDEKDDEEDDGRYIDLPEWTPADGYRLMERFAAELKNPVARQELSAALNRSKGVFRAFKDTIEQYPEIEKLWYSYKDKKMREEIILWYNGLREEWGLEPIGVEPEDNSALVLEDFVISRRNAPYLGFTAKNADGEICGEISTVKDEKGLYVNRFKVEPQYRGMGLGKALLSKLLEHAKDKEITMDLPAKSEFFARSLHLEGFKPVMQRFKLTR